MTFLLTDLASPDRVSEIRHYNDRVRKSLSGGVVMLTAGVVALGASNQARIIEAVRQFEDFDDGDPTDLHAIGDVAVEIEEPGIARWPELIFFRIDRTSIDADPVLTIMLASEW